MRLYFWASVVSCCAALWGYACASGDETSGSTSTTSVQSSVQTGAQSSSDATAASTVGVGGTANTGGMGGHGDGGGAGGLGGAGGMGPCVSCNDAVGQCIVNNACPPESQLCAGGALSSYQALKSCLCPRCAADCPKTCTNMGMDTTNCSQCVQTYGPTTCSSVFTNCAVN